MSDIRISEKHGINPCMLVCQVCGESYAIALPGYIKGDKKAPKQIIQGFCDDCQKALDKSIMIVEKDSNNETMRVVGVDKTSSLFTEEFLGPQVKEILKTGGMFVTTEDWEYLGLPSHEEIAERKENKK